MSSDDELLDLIANTVASDQPPAYLVQAAYESRSWVNVDAELAALIEDSADAALAGMRSGDTRRLVFEGPGVLDLEIDMEAQLLRGTLDPSGIVSLERSDGSRTVLEAGASVASFTVSDVPAGPLRINIESDTTNWATDWFTV